MYVVMLLCYSFRILHYTSLGAVEDPAHNLPLSAQTGISLKWELEDLTRYSYSQYKCYLLYELCRSFLRYLEEHLPPVSFLQSL